MKGDGTEYVLTRDPAVLERAHAFLHGHGADTEKMVFPTLLALRDNKVIGVIGTQIIDDTIVAGPFVVHVPNGPNGIVAYRLVENYFNVMRNLGIVEFYALVENDNPEYKNMLETLLNIEPFTFHSNVWWYRIATNGWK